MNEFHAPESCIKCFLEIFRHAEYESARRDKNFLWVKSLNDECSGCSLLEKNLYLYGCTGC